MSRALLIILMFPAVPGHSSSTVNGPADVWPAATDELGEGFEDAPGAESCALGDADTDPLGAGDALIEGLTEGLTEGLIDGLTEGLVETLGDELEELLGETDVVVTNPPCSAQVSLPKPSELFRGVDCTWRGLVSLEVRARRHRGSFSSVALAARAP
jgi:hypothetical protein